MKLSDCEITHRHMRGHNVAFIFGDRAASDAELRELVAEFIASYGPGHVPAYSSPEGWQTVADEGDEHAIPVDEAAAKPGKVGKQAKV